jgi:hypothetical protein
MLRQYVKEEWRDEDYVLPIRDGTTGASFFIVPEEHDG